jgi:polyhydroxyalkanoate synthesis regulator phasin
MDDSAVASNPIEESDLGSSTFEDAYSKATSSTLPSSKEEDTPIEGEVQLDAEAEKPAQEDDKKTPLDEFDPEKLPPELKGVYKNLMKGFTQGRQKDREELNALREELSSLKSQAPAPEVPAKPMTLEEKVDQLVEQKVTQGKLTAFREQALADYDGIDPRLTQPTDDKPNDQYDKLMDHQVGAELDVLLQEHIDKTGSELGFDYKTHAKRLVAEWDGYVQKKVDAFLSKQRDMAKKGERSFEKTNPKTSATSTKPSGAMSLEQAVNAAYRKHHA